MAKYLGIDYGAKRIGLALSDEGGEFAFPESILENDKKTLDKIKALCQTKGVMALVVGESMNLVGQPNKIMKEINEFKEKLQDLGLPIHSQKEFMTSHLAEGLQRYMNEPVQDRARKTKSEKKFLDDAAAALILQRYLDKTKNAT
jgi:putative Holliday junction resolvase